MNSVGLGGKPESTTIEMGQAQISEPAVEVEDLVVRYGGQRAVDGVTLSFGAGFVTGIIGPNGAGKTSLVGAISGVTPIEMGTIRFGGADVTGTQPYRLARAGLIKASQQPRVFGRLSVLDNLLVADPSQVGERFSIAVRGGRLWKAQERASEERAMLLLSDFDLVQHAKTKSSLLSGGQQKIVEYLRALMARPKVLILDEPSVGLAAHLVQRLASDLPRLAQEGCCVVLIEHEMGLIKAASDRVIGMVAGRVVVDGDYESVVHSEALQRAYLGGE